MNTIYEKDKADFSNRAHMAARALIYPRAFGVPQECIRFEDTLLADSERSAVYDAEFGIDRVLHIVTPKLKAPLVFPIQERFRESKYAPYRDVTITEWNGASDLPSELYKIRAGHFAYGYYNELTQSFTDAIVINVPDLLSKLAAAQIEFGRGRNPKNQSFVTVSFDELIRTKCVMWHQNGNGARHH